MKEKVNKLFVSWNVFQLLVLSLRFLYMYFLIPFFQKVKNVVFYYSRRKEKLINFLFPEIYLKLLFLSFKF